MKKLLFVFAIVLCTDVFSQEFYVNKDSLWMESLGENLQLRHLKTGRYLTDSLGNVINGPYDYAHIGNLRTYIFMDILRRALKYNGYDIKGVMNITDVGHLTSDEDDGDDILHKRMLDLLSHGNYSLFNPIEMVDENKGHFRNILNNFLEDYKFNEKLFESTQTQENEQ